MGNQMSSSSSIGRVILSDGRVHEYSNPLTVAELMLENPQQVVVEFQSAVNGRRPIPLPADKKLEMDKVYLMLPMRRGKPPASLSSEEARQLLAVANSLFLSSGSTFLSLTTGFVPLFARMCTAGPGEVYGFVTGRKERPVVEREEEVKKVEFLPESLELGIGPEYYLSRQVSGKGWKPSLDTIKEKVSKKKVSHWLF